MKKLLAILLSAVMVLSLVACGQKEEPAPAPAPEAGQEEAPTAKTVKVGLICIGDENDQGYTYNFIRGKEAATKALADKGITVEWIVKYNIGEDSKCEDANIELAEEGCKIIINNSFGHEPYMLQAAKEFPEVQFCHATGTQAHTAGVANYHNAFANIYEGRFLGGVAAGMKLNEMIAAGEITAEECLKRAQEEADEAISKAQD